MKKKMKFLFITKDWNNGIEKNTVYLANQLSECTQYMEWNKPGDIRSILDKLPFKPDFILLNDFRSTRCPEITGLKNLKIPFGIIIHDLSYKPKQRKSFIIDNNIKHLFVHYKDSFINNYSEFKDRMIWFPHYVNTDVFKDYKLPKSYDYLMMGCMNRDIYPLRAQMLNTMNDLPGFKYHEHPGYGKSTYTEKNNIVGKRYAKEINRSKIFLTDNSIYHYPLMKYFEVLACNTLLLAPYSKEIAQLGFIPSVNFVEVNEKTYLEKAKYYLDNYDSIGKKIAKKGFEMVNKNHSVVHRSSQFIKKIEEIIGW